MHSWRNSSLFLFCKTANFSKLENSGVVSGHVTPSGPAGRGVSTSAAVSGGLPESTCPHIPVPEHSTRRQAERKRGRQGLQPGHPSTHQGQPPRRQQHCPSTFLYGTRRDLPSEKYKYEKETALLKERSKLHTQRIDNTLSEVPPL